MHSVNFTNDHFREKITNLLNVCYSSADVSTKQDFAKALGTNYLQLYRWMEGKTIPRKESLKKICEVCEIDFMTFMSLEDYDKNPHKLMTLSVLDGLYTKSEIEGDRASSETIIGFACVCVHDLLKYLGISLKLNVTGASEFSLPLTRGQIDFTDPRLADLHIVVYGGTDSLYIRCYSDINDVDIHTTKLTVADVNRLGLLIRENYLKQND